MEYPIAYSDALALALEGSIPVVKFKKLRPEAKLPTRGSSYAAGLDLSAVESVTIPPGGHAMVSTGLAIELPEHHEGQVRSRSGLAAKNGVFVLNSPGTIDQDYRGEVKVILANNGHVPFSVNAGDRIAQLVIAPVTYAKVEEVIDLSDSDRGEKGFGSSGV